MAYRYIIFPFLLLSIFACKNQDAPREPYAKLPKKVDFNFHIKPILSDRCFKCHGPDEKVREANFRLDLKESAFAQLDKDKDSYAIVPGDVEKSKLYRRISSNNPDLMMPPPESNLELSPHEIQLLKLWIEQGAEWKDHWAFIPPTQNQLPAIEQEDWPNNEIDHFVLNKMEGQNLHPTERASKEKLIRRLSFDLRGIAPTIEEIDQFLADETPAAYEKLIDRFMASPSYGERLGMEWLDVARYADSHGYQDDIERSMWPWRDWVIQAFNDNMPYDQFVSWQLAGDLMPDASYEQKLATGFNRNHKITQEVGVVDEEYRVEYVLDRVNTVSTSFLGLTVACAQCHDHKFDPISQKEFYSMFSFFNNVPEQGRVEYNVEVAEPSLPLPEETVSQYKTAIQQLIDQQQRKIADYEKNLAAKTPNSAELDMSQIDPGTMPTGLVSYFPLDYVSDSLLFESQGKTLAGKTHRGPVPIAGKYAGGLEFSSKNSLDLGPMQNIDFRRPFSVSFWVQSINGGIGGPILAPTYKEKVRKGFNFNISNEKAFVIYAREPKNKKSISLRSRKEIPEDTWVHMTLTSDGSFRDKGFQLYMNGEKLELISSGESSIRKPAPHTGVKIARRDQEKGLISGQLDELMFFNKTLSPQEVESLYRYNPIAAIMQQKEKSHEENKRLLYQQLHHQDPQYQKLVQRHSEYRIRSVRLEDVVLKPTMVMADMDTLRPTFVLDRGAYDAPTEQVYAGTPKHVMPFPQEYPKNRLGFAKWLFHPHHPLTARVAVNRYWQMIFGRGIVATPEDFGSQGDLPTHPELLDWLALEFQNSGWDLKGLLKKMLMSATYQQGIETNPRIQEQDPNNLFLARGPSMRLPAEMVRDHALRISGLLSTHIGGPSVKPYHPEGLWLETASGNQPLRKYIQDHEQDLYRKSMYTFWKRTIPPPSMMTFDAPTREECIVKRQATSTPMQALVLLNDPQFIEASRLIAERMLAEGGNQARDRIGFAFRLATSRKATKKELDILEDLLQQQHLDFEQEPQKAQEFLSIGEYPLNDQYDMLELAAYTQVANAILNLTESIQKA